MRSSFFGLSSLLRINVCAYVFGEVELILNIIWLLFVFLFSAMFETFSFVGFRKVYRR